MILKEEPAHRMNYMKLLKLLTISERESLRSSGRMITGDRIAALPRGPLPSRIYDLIKGTDIESPQWSTFFDRRNYEIELRVDPGNGLLSKWEIDLLQDVTRRYADKDEWDMVEITHLLPEWKKNKPPEGSRCDISVKDILEGVGYAAGEADQIIEEAATETGLDMFFAEHDACNSEIGS